MLYAFIDKEEEIFLVFSYEIFHVFILLVITSSVAKVDHITKLAITVSPPGINLNSMCDIAIKTAKLHVVGYIAL